MNFAEKVAKANSRFTHKHRNRTVNAGVGGNPRFELYHAAPSLCSMKVRTVLAEKSVPYVSHDLNIMVRKDMPECYLPDYVRMRLLGAPEAEFAQGYTGQSSVTTEGFDPCVVPTLVDHEKEKVVVDSSRICVYLDEETSGDRLIPGNLSNEIGAQISLIDQAPHVATLYGAHPDHDPRPKGLKTNIAGVHAKKIVKLEAARDEAGDEATLVAAYDAKISKESSAADFVFSPDRMRDIHKAMFNHVGDLEAQLSTHNGEWVMGERFSMADIMWTVSIYRMKWLGLGSAWEGNSERGRVQEYVQYAFDRPSFRAGVVDWPFAYGPSPHVPEFAGIGATIRFFIELFRRGQR